MTASVAPLERLHPVTRLLGWLALLVLVQHFDGWLLSASFAIVPLLGPALRQRAWRLVIRARWLLASLFLVFAWGTAGDPLFETVFAPTVEGLQEAGRHLGRMLLVLIAVAAFLERMRRDDLLVAGHHLLYPLHRLGWRIERGALRMHLVLLYVETLPRPRDWRQLLRGADEIPGGGVSCEQVAFDRRPLAAIDWACILLGGGLLIVAILAGGRA